MRITVVGAILSVAAVAAGVYLLFALLNIEGQPTENRSANSSPDQVLESGIGA